MLTNTFLGLANRFLLCGLGDFVISQRMRWALSRAFLVIGIPAVFSGMVADKHLIILYIGRFCPAARAVLMANG